jgi:hypothetical protein
MRDYFQVSRAGSPGKKKNWHPEAVPAIHPYCCCGKIWLSSFGAFGLSGFLPTSLPPVLQHSYCTLLEHFFSVVSPSWSLLFVTKNPPNLETACWKGPLEPRWAAALYSEGRFLTKGCSWAGRVCWGQGRVPGLKSRASCMLSSHSITESFPSS